MPERTVTVNEIPTRTENTEEHPAGTRAYLELAQGLSRLRYAMDSAAQKDNVTFLEMNRWRTSLQALERLVAGLHAQAEGQQLTLAHALHDIRGTVGVVRGYSELVLRTKETAGQTRDIVARILVSADTLNGLLDELLTIFRCDAGKMRVTPHWVPLRQEVSVIAEAYGHAAREKRLQFDCRYMESLPASVKVDVLLLRRILGNVLENAVKYTPSGAIVLDVRYFDGAIVFEVVDTGPGVAHALIPALFEPYAQTSATAERAPGNGLGLSVVRRLCQAMGGEVTYAPRSAEGGSRFRMRIPAEAGED